METIATPGLEALIARAEQALSEEEPWNALVGFLGATLEAQLTDPSLTIVRAAPERVLPRTEELTTTLGALAGRLLDCTRIGRRRTWRARLAGPAAAHVRDRFRRQHPRR
ncbi:hypothetical protein ACIQ6Y_32630 [Streptomyces sp. NPDC096205]|uniref:hypothetical protein n=1 Tax=Streptomyces sp. NPDC096205 TaxID=3366081 RepID=UPI003808B77E